MRKTTITQKELKRMLHYNKNSGVFKWKINDINIKKGQLCGWSCKRGYNYITFNRKKYLAHRLAFLYVKGYIPEYVDHKDGNPSNNKWNNLRVATLSQNGMNKRKQSNNKSGYKGVRFNKKYLKKPWSVRIVVNKKEIYIGIFKSKIEAARAYDKAALKYFGEYAKLNFERKI